VQRLHKELKDDSFLSTEQKKLISYKKQQQQLDETQAKVKSYSDSLQKLQTEIKNTESPSKALLNQQRREEKQLEKLIDQETKRTLSLRKLQQALKKIGVSTNELALAEKFLQERSQKGQLESLRLAKEKLAITTLTTKQQQQNLNQMSQSLDQAGYSTKNLGKTQVDLSRNIKQTNSELDKQQQKLQRTTD
jgi:uncharacterized protein Smg (DUF494 family)